MPGFGVAEPGFGVPRLGFDILWFGLGFDKESLPSSENRSAAAGGGGVPERGRMPTPKEGLVLVPGQQPQKCEAQPLHGFGAVGLRKLQTIYGAT